MHMYLCRQNICVWCPMKGSASTQDLHSKSLMRILQLNGPFYFSKANVCSYLQLVALAEGTWLKLDDARDLLRRCGGDIRRCLLQLQLWVCSGGRQASQTCEQRTLLSGSQCKRTFGASGDFLGFYFLLYVFLNFMIDLFYSVYLFRLECY